MSNIKQEILLASVIPAYKAKYLPVTLESLVAQTDKRFNVYIGDDKSPEEIESIVKRYEGKINYVYHRFEENLGGQDLVAQWKRCIEMTQGEEWIWLFSDDDYIDAKCVEAFYRELNAHVNNDLYRFNLNITNNTDISNTPDLPNLVTPTGLFKKKMDGKCPVFAVEYIFSRKIYEQQGGFQNFDLAWHSDIATWMKFGQNGIVTISGPKVTWRSSGENITTKSDENLNIRKWNATVAFFLWLRNVYYKGSCKNQCVADYYFIKTIHGASKIFSQKHCLHSAREYFGKGLRRTGLLIAFKCYQFLSHVKM